MRMNGKRYLNDKYFEALNPQYSKGGQAVFVIRFWRLNKIM